MIVVGQLAPGSAIIESRLAERLGLSRTPVRAALQRLQQAGYVHVQKPGKYARLIVAPLSTADMRELFRIMGNLESLGSAALAAQPPERRMAVADEMEAINLGLLDAAHANPPDLRRAQDLHVQFHRMHVQAAGGPRLKAQIAAIHPLVERYERLYTQALIAQMPISVQEHAGIVLAIRVGDAEVAERRTTLNWRNGAERYDRAVSILGERGFW
jgi:DNA-binding GntR family transcriptional regulator